MKEFGRRTLALLLAFSSVLLGGCQVLDVFSVDSLIRPPKLTGGNALIQSAFEQAVGVDVTLVNPLQGAYRSAFVFYDYDNDGEEETVVFYTKSDAQGEVRMHFLDREDGIWNSVSDLSGNGSTVFEVEFSDLDADRNAELIVTWTVSDSKRNKTLSVYQYGKAENGERGFLQRSAVQNMSHLILDFDFDGKKDILYLYADTSSQAQSVKAVVTALDDAAWTFAPVSEVELSRLVEYPLNCFYDLRDGKYRVYFDCLNFDDTYMTEILYFDRETSALTRPNDAEGNALCQRTIRNDPLFCSSNYGGNYIDIPVLDPYEGSFVYDSENDVSGQLYMTTYMELEENAFVPSSASYYCDTADDVMFRLEAYVDDCFLIHETKEHTLRFCLREDPDASAFSIQFFDQNVRGREKYRILISDNKVGLTSDSIKRDIEQLQR